MKIHFGLLGVLLLFSCQQKPQYNNALAAALASTDQRIRQVLDSPAPYQVQIRYTQIDSTKAGVIFTDYDFQVADNNYFYPASTVKLPTAIAALEKLNNTDSLDLNTKFYAAGDSLETTFAQSIEAVFAVSDNAAHNRLIEFLGFDALNQSIAHKTKSPIRIAHRLSTPNADDVTTKPLVIYMNDSTTALSNPIISQAPKALQLQNTQKGKAYMSQGAQIPEAFDFSLKNYYPITTQHQVLKQLIFPNAFAAKERFKLSAAQRKFLLAAMASLPYQKGYNRDTYYDSYVKFFMFGDNKAAMPASIKIYNKVGYAYGTLTDCAYIQDHKNKVAFLLTATILVNKNEVFNDDVYEYDAIGIPFLAQLGREIYNYELGRK